MGSHNFSEELYKHSSTGQFVLDKQGVIIQANKSFQRMIDSEGNNPVTGEELVNFIFDEDIEDWSFAFNTFFSEPEAKTLLNIRYKKAGRVSWWKLYLDKVLVEENTYILGVAVDISGEIESQGDLLLAKQAAEKSEASKSIFLANMSHEIRTPIHTVTGLTELLDNTDLDSEQNEYVSQIGFAAKVLLTLINDILDFSKIEAGKLTFENIEYNLYETVINSVDLSALEAHKKGVDVAISIDPAVPMFIIGDQVRLRQVIVNLMSNAVKFTRQGEIVLSVKAKDIDNGKTLIGFSVADSGIGISKTKQARLFQAFSQADASTTREYGGTGLGLSISFSLVQMMGGKMTVSSEEGKGAKFSFQIPVKNGRSINPVFVEPPIEGLKALVVDDNVKVNRIFSNLLRSWNYDVIEVYNGMDALNELIIKASMGEPYDLCFIDQILPGMDGWQLASEIHSNSLIKTTKTLLMSLKGKGIEESKMKLLGWFQGYLTKPVNKKDLYYAIEDLYTRTSEVDIDDSDEIEELESLDDNFDDDDYMEPLEFNEDEVVEDLIPVDEKEYSHELSNFKSMSSSGIQEEVDMLSSSFDEDDSVNILVVEDHLVNQKLFKVILEKEGYTVLVASDGKEAIEIVESNNLDLIFMDCQMPVMNGYDSSIAIRGKGYKIPIVAVTASAVKGEHEKCISSGMNDVMTKPFKREDVVKALEKWLK